jgi:protein-disulfide isomerase
VTHEPTSGDGSARQPIPTPVTVVGYPDHAPVPSGQSVPGLAGVKMAVTSLRVLAVVTLVLVVLLTAGLVAGILTLRGQVSALSQQVTELAEQRAVSQAPTPDTEVADPESGAITEQSGVEQLPAAPELPSGVPIPAGVDGSGAILIGNPDASSVVEVYADYQCPYCQRWEQQIGEALAERALDPSSDLLIKVYNLAFLGETSPTLDPPGSSARAASAALCVLEGEGPEAFADFNAQLFALADPDRSSVQFQAPELLQMATDSGASAETIACIDAERHVTFVALTTQSGFSRGVQGTPTVIVNGRTVESTFDDPELISLLG